jgi:nitroreductase/NAD-dependent dihydropyrimidine dehydrogenase PreA subunit
MRGSARSARAGRGSGLDGPRLMLLWFYFMERLKVDESKCTRCGLCGKVCPVTAIVAGEGALPHEDGRKMAICVDCGHCEAYCPKGALAHEYGGEVLDAGPLEKISINAHDLGLYVKNRRSVRLFKDKPVDRAGLESLLDIVRYAPSGKNDQPVKWIVLHDRAELERVMAVFLDWVRSLLENDSPLKRMLPAAATLKLRTEGNDLILRGAPHVIIAYTSDAALMGPASVADGIIALTHLDILLPAFGMGGFWAGYFTLGLRESEEVKAAAGIPAGHHVNYSFALGYPKYETRALPKRKKADVLWS